MLLTAHSYSLAACLAVAHFVPKMHNDIRKKGAEERDKSMIIIQNKSV